jgi:hypothetical protein
MEHSYFNFMLYLFQEDCKQPEATKLVSWTYIWYNSYLHENIKQSCYSSWEDPDLKWKEDFPVAKLLTSVKKN